LLYLIVIMMLCTTRIDEILALTLLFLWRNFIDDLCISALHQ